VTADAMPPERATPVRLLIGGTWIAATAYGVRHGRRGAQVLVGCHGRLIWVSASRVHRADGAGQEAKSSA